MCAAKQISHSSARKLHSSGSACLPQQPQTSTSAVNSSQMSKHKADFSTDDAPQESFNRRSKRLRVSQACQQCRKRKERCNGEQPRCGSCLLSDRLCCYDPRTRKRGLQAGYVRAMEILLGLISQACDGYEDIIIAVLQGKRKIGKLSTSAPMITQLADIWKNSQVMKELETVLGRFELKEDQELSTRELQDQLELAFTNSLVLEDGLAVAQESHENLFAPISPPQTVTTVASAHVELSIFQSSTPKQFSLPVLTGDPLQEDSEIATDLPPDWSRLLDIYFANIHSWFPIASKHDAFRQVFSLLSSTTEEEGRSVLNGERASLFAMLALAAYQDGALKRREGKECGIAFDLSRRLQDTSNSMLARAHGTSTYQPSHLQALLSLTILQIQAGNMSTAWITIGQAVYTATILDIIPQTAHIEILEDSCKRLFFGVYVLETLIAFRLERRSYFRKSDIKTVGPLSVDGIEEWEPWRPIDLNSTRTSQQSRTPGQILSFFNYFVQLVSLLPELSTPESNTTDVLREFQTWQMGLSLSQCVALSSLDRNEAAVSPQLLNLSLASVSIRMKIHSQAATTNTTATTPISSSVQQLLTVKHHIEREKSWDCPLMGLYDHILTNYEVFPDLSDQLNNAPLDLRTAVHTNSERIPNQVEYESFQDPSSSGENSFNAINHTLDLRLDKVAGIVQATPTTALQEQDLFDSLALLDTAECSQNTEQFLENLGISRGISPVDFRTFFNFAGDQEGLVDY